MELKAKVSAKKKENKTKDHSSETGNENAKKAKESQSSSKSKPVSPRKKSKAKKKSKKDKKPTSNDTEENMDNAPPMEVLEESTAEVEFQLRNNKIIAVREENSNFFIEYVRPRISNHPFIQIKPDFGFGMTKTGVSLISGNQKINEISFNSQQISNITGMSVDKDVFLISSKNGDLFSVRVKDKKLKFKEELNIKAELALFQKLEDELIVLNLNWEVFMVNDKRMRLIARDLGKIIAMSVQKGCVWLLGSDGKVSAFDLQTCKQVSSFSFSEKMLSGFFLEGKVALVQAKSIKIFSLEGEMLKEIENLSNFAMQKLHEASSFAVLIARNKMRLEVLDKNSMEVVRFEELNDEILYSPNFK